MIGRRVHADENGWFNEKLEPGDYVKVDPKRMADGSPLPDGFAERYHYPYWLCCAPNGHSGALGRHTVVEHEDGTITVSPSILITTRRDEKDVELFHGYLERGVWRSC
jgi:hypothetical protein